MNRIVLIGNGFDLAHGMPTKYTNFLDDFWKKTTTAISKQGRESSPYKGDYISLDGFPIDLLDDSDYSTLKKCAGNSKVKIKFQNGFLKIISDSKPLRSWVDLEDEYYTELKKIIDNKSMFSIDELNQDFEQIKKLLNEYLLKVEKEFDDKKLREIGKKIYSSVISKDLSYEMQNYLAKTKYEELKPSLETIHFNNKESKGFSPERMEFIKAKGISHEHRELLKKTGTEQPLKKLKELLTTDDGHTYYNLKLDSLLFLNFNYTFTDELYSNPKNFGYDGENPITPESIHIHGSIHERDKNPIIFGFGDEIDEKYKEIENLNENQYLENIKSIKYLESDNYKRLLEYINSDSYQVFIMGHSCGISDRTLLNTLFEHPNCVSVKVYYHQKNENEDNYSDIVRNISRSFNDKAVYRDKVVNKTYCEPLVDH